MHEAFRHLLWEVVRSPRFRTQDALARALGMDAGHLNRAMGVRGAYTFSLENCLRLAKVAHLSPSVVLKAAGKSGMDRLMASLYGRRRLSVEDEALLEALHDIEDAGLRRHAVGVVRGLARQDRLARTAAAPARKRRPKR